MIVDGHVHLTAARADGARRRRGGSPTLTLEDYNEVMDQAGVGRAVLATSTRTDGFDNRYVADAAAGAPERLAGVGALDVMAPDAADTLSYWIEERGLRGMRLFGGSSVDAADWLPDERVTAVLRRAEALRVPVSAQRTRIGTLAALRRVAQRFPGVAVIVYSAADPALGSGGRSPEVDQLLALADLPNIHLSVSPANVAKSFQHSLGHSPLFADLAKAFGPGRLMWGSYSMFADAAPQDRAAALLTIVAAAREAFSFLPDEDAEWAFGRTATSLFWP
jgi:predicted TIM-barrel fold metal-dependent hydrolase